MEIDVKTNDEEKEIILTLKNLNINMEFEDIIAVIVASKNMLASTLTTVITSSHAFNQKIFGESNFKGGPLVSGAAKSKMQKHSEEELKGLLFPGSSRASDRVSKRIERASRADEGKKSEITENILMCPKYNVPLKTRKACCGSNSVIVTCPKCRAVKTIKANKKQ